MCSPCFLVQQSLFLQTLPTVLRHSGWSCDELPHTIKKATVVCNGNQWSNYGVFCCQDCWMKTGINSACYFSFAMKRANQEGQEGRGRGESPVELIVRDLTPSPWWTSNGMISWRSLFSNTNSTFSPTCTCIDLLWGMRKSHASWALLCEHRLHVDCDHSDDGKFWASTKGQCHFVDLYLLSTLWRFLQAYNLDRERFLLASNSLRGMKYTNVKLPLSQW